MYSVSWPGMKDRVWQMHSFLDCNQYLGYIKRRIDYKLELVTKVQRALAYTSLTLA